MPRRREIPPALKDSDQPVRSTVDMSGSSYYCIYKLVSEFGLNMGSVIDALVATMDEQKVRRFIEERRRKKVLKAKELLAIRKMIYRSLKKPTLEQLELVDKIVDLTQEEKKIL